jgi:hypothetical protein
VTANLHNSWQSHLERALAWKPGADPEPVLEALGYVLVLKVAGKRDWLPPSQARSLRKIGAECLLSLDTQEGDEEDRIIIERIADQARSALFWLEHPKKRLNVRAADVHPSDARLVRVLNGRVDGLTAGEVACHVIRCPECAGRVELVMTTDRLARADEGLALAAASPASVRPPSEGRTVGTRKRPAAAEAVLFAEKGRAPRLAVYADEMVSVRVVAEGVKTETALAGYWMGRVKRGVDRLTATVYIGDRTFTWKLDLG